MRFPSIAARLAAAAALFAAPVGVVLFQLFSQQNAAIVAARSELVGVHYVRAIAPIGEALLKAQIGRDVKGLSAAGENLEAIDRKFHVGPKSAEKAHALAQGLREAAAVSDLPSLHLAWRRLVACVGNQSRLILDNSLDSFYLQDVAVSKMPEALTRLAWMVHVVQRTGAAGGDGGDVNGALIGLKLSSESIATSLASAYAASSDGALQAALAEPYARVSSALGVFQAKAQRGEAGLEDARAVLEGTQAFPPRSRTSSSASSPGASANSSRRGFCRWRSPWAFS